MTPLAGFIIALIAGWFARDARRAAVVVVVPYLGVVAGQTWAISDGRGTSPPSTVWPFGAAISYYVVQAIIFALALGVAAMLGAVRARRAATDDGAEAAGRRAAVAATVDVVLTAAFITIALLVTAPVHHHAAEGSPPWYGLLGIGALLVSLIVLSVLLFSGRRAARRARQAVAAGSTAVASGSRVAAITAVGALAVLGASAGLTQAKASPAVAGGIVQIYESGIGGQANHDVITGAFTDYGVDHLDALDHGNVNQIVLSEGSFEANVSKLHARLREVSGNARTCSLVLRSTAPVKLSHGTGKYKGIQGTITVTVENAVVFPKKENGMCNENIQTVVPLENLTSVTGSGRVTF